MKKYNAFTLAEIIVSMVIIATMATVMFVNLQRKDFSDRTFSLSAYKAMEVIQQASSKVREFEKDNRCPTGTFMANVMGTYEYTILNKAEGLNATSEEVVNLFGDYMKYQQSSLNFCDYTSYCSNSNIKGAKITGNMYIGFEVFNGAANCPTSYYVPNSSDNVSADLVTKTAAQAGKCWGNFYLDTNGTEGPDTLGKDVYIWGLGETGLVY